MSNELEHFGIKGMKWGVIRPRPTTGSRRVGGGGGSSGPVSRKASGGGGSSGPVSYGKQKKQLKAERDQKQQKARSDFDKAERAHDDLVGKIQKENRAKGMGRFEAARAANKDPRAKKSWDKLSALEERTVSESKNADKKYSKDSRDLVVSKMNWNNKTRGEKAISLIVDGPAAATAQHLMVTHPNTSKGKKLLAVYMLGPLAVPAVGAMERRKANKK